jgi:hypothetical protein
MPYNADDNWVYETEALGMGDPIRVALSHLQRNLEAFLYDRRDPGYANPDMLAWALENSKVTASSSGTLANQALRWDPKYADVESIESDTTNSDNANKFYDGTIHARKPEFGTDAEGPEPIDFEGEVVVTRPEYARLVNGEPRVVTEYAQVDEAGSDEESSVPGVPYPADERAVIHEDHDESEVIETPADEYQPVEHDEDKE